MAYDATIPKATDQLSVSQGNILTNFAFLGAIAGNSNPASASINTSLTNSGFNWIYLPPNSATPPTGSSFPTGNVALYSALNSTTSQNELYINKQNQSTTVQIAATASTLSVSSTPGIGLAWTNLPSGLIIKTGQNTGALSGLQTVTISSGGVNGPAFNQILNVIVCPANGSSTGDLNFAVRLVDISGTNSFRIYISNRTTTGAASGQTGFQYFAIGY